MTRCIKIILSGLVLVSFLVTTLAAEKNQRPLHRLG